MFGGHARLRGRGCRMAFASLLLCSRRALWLQRRRVRLTQRSVTPGGASTIAKVLVRAILLCPRDGIALPGAAGQRFPRSNHQFIVAGHLQWVGSWALTRQATMARRWRPLHAFHGVQTVVNGVLA